MIAIGPNFNPRTRPALPTISTPTVLKEGFLKKLESVTGTKEFIVVQGEPLSDLPWLGDTLDTDEPQ